MKISIIAVLITISFFTSCVQKKYKKTVVFTVNTSAKKNITTVGIRGNGKPLSWNEDVALVASNKDSSYSIPITFETGYTFTEVKFVINDTLELQDKGNRRINFEKGDTTFYQCVFDKE